MKRTSPLGGAALPARQRAIVILASVSILAGTGALAAGSAHAADPGSLGTELQSLRVTTDALLRTSDFEVSMRDTLGYGMTLVYGVKRDMSGKSLWVQDANSGGVLVAAGPGVGLPNGSTMSFLGQSTYFTDAHQSAPYQQMLGRQGWNGGTLISIPFDQATRWPNAIASPSDRDRLAESFVDSMTPEAWVTDALALVTAQGATISKTSGGGVDTYVVAVGGNSYTFDVVNGIIDRATRESPNQDPYERALRDLDAQVVPPTVAGGVAASVAWPKVAPIMRIPDRIVMRPAVRRAADVVGAKMGKEKTRSVSRMRTLLAAAFAAKGLTPGLRARTSGVEVSFPSAWGAVRFTVLIPAKVGGTLGLKG